MLYEYFVSYIHKGDYGFGFGNQVVTLTRKLCIKSGDVHAIEDELVADNSTFDVVVIIAFQLDNQHEETNPSESGEKMGQILPFELVSDLGKQRIRKGGE